MQVTLDTQGTPAFAGEGMHDAAARRRESSAAGLRAATGLHEFSARLLRSGDGRAMLGVALDAVIELQDADSGCVHLREPGDDGLVLVAHRNFEREFVERFARVADADDVCVRAAHARTTIVVEAVERDLAHPAQRQAAAAAGFRALMAAPLLGQRGEVIGVLSTYFARPDAPAEELLKLGELYVAHAALLFGYCGDGGADGAHLPDTAHAARLASLGELAASLAHELGQPLAAIMANGNACRRWLDREAPQLERALASLDQLVSNAERARGVVRRVRAFSRREPLPVAPLDLDEVIGEVLALTRDHLADHEVEVQTTLAGTLPTTIGDRIQLQQVLLNLVLNGLEAMRCIDPAARRLCIDSRAVDEGIEVVVSDCGHGVSPADLPRLFEPFFTTRPRGVGLGLAISRRIIEAHGGQLSAMPAHGGGLRVRFWLPAAAGPGA